MFAQRLPKRRKTSLKTALWSSRPLACLLQTSPAIGLRKPGYDWDAHCTAGDAVTMKRAEGFHLRSNYLALRGERISNRKTHRAICRRVLADQVSPCGHCVRTSLVRTSRRTARGCTSTKRSGIERLTCTVQIRIAGACKIRQLERMRTPSTGSNIRKKEGMQLDAYMHACIHVSESARHLNDKARHAVSGTALRTATSREDGLTVWNDRMFD
ncbi:hypothetical protein IWX49DRAFT_198569 [Phyllosticta citricarpa]|uniref:Uncharacterized protein n=1 Tax=Phyllosticta paracitricarpa TaxID=2016321 RepID=A0ABR1N027_9PEZI